MVTDGIHLDKDYPRPDWLTNDIVREITRAIYDISEYVPGGEIGVAMAALVTVLTLKRLGLINEEITIYMADVAKDWYDEQSDKDKALLDEHTKLRHGMTVEQYHKHVKAKAVGTLN